MQKKGKYQEIIQNLVSSRKFLISAICLIGASVLLVVIYNPFIKKTDSNIWVAHQQIWELAKNIRHHYQKRPDAWGLNNNYLIEKGIADQSLIFDGTLHNTLGKDILVGADIDGSTVMPGRRNFAITYKNLTYEECVQLASIQLDEQQQQLSLTAILISNLQAQTQFIWGGQYPLPITYKAAKETCEKENSITWFLYL